MLIEQCDQDKPCCAACARRKLTCAYTTSNTVAKSRPVRADSPKKIPVNSSSEERHLSLRSPDAKAYNLSIQAVQDRLNEILSAFNTKWLPIVDERKSLRDLQHFQAITTQTLGFSTSRKIVATFVSQAIWQFAHLMHMVLAVANAHQKRLYYMDNRESSRTDLPIAEAGHWQVALTMYQEEVERLRNGATIGQDGADALLGTNLLSTVYTSTVGDDVPIDIFLTGDEHVILEVLSPMIHSGGFPVLLSLLPDIETTSRWMAMLNTADDNEHTFTDYSPGIRGLPAAWISLCELTPESTCDNSPYLRLLKTLTPLLRLKLGRADMPKLFAYIGRNWAHSKHLFISKDPIALLFIAWWLALLRQLDLWWITTRASTKCAAIVKYLRSLNDPRIEAFLSFPASFGLADYSWIWLSDWEVLQRIMEEDALIHPQHMCVPS